MRIHQRVAVFCVSLSLSFATLILFIASVEALVLMVLLISASVVLASKEDLDELRSDKNLIIFMVLLVATIIGGSTALSPPSDGTELFYVLASLNVVFLGIYVTLRRFARLYRAS